MSQGKYQIDGYEHATHDVMYVANNIPGPGIDKDEFESEFAVGCECPNDICDSGCPCVHSTPNYRENGTLNVEKLSGLVIECNSCCSCGPKCANKLVQNGPLDCLEIVETPGKGLGLGTQKFIGKNRFICEYAGEVISLEEAKIRSEINRRDGNMNYILVVSEHIGAKKYVTCIDPKFFGNIGRYCNHSCRPNATLVPIRVETNVPRLCLFALRDIDVDEEITFDYAGGTSEKLGNKSDTPCRCGADCCLGFLPNYPI